MSERVRLDALLIGDVSVTALNILAQAGFVYVDQIDDVRDHELLRLKHFGRLSLRKIRYYLRKHREENAWWCEDCKKRHPHDWAFCAYGGRAKRTDLCPSCGRPVESQGHEGRE